MYAPAWVDRLNSFVLCKDVPAHVSTGEKRFLDVLESLFTRADVDGRESLSNILGKPIRKRAADSVTFADGSTEKTEPARMTEEEKRRFVSLIKPYLWWGE